MVDSGRPGGRRYFRSAGGLARSAGSAAQRARPRRRRPGAQAADGPAARRHGPLHAGDAGAAQEQSAALPSARPQFAHAAPPGPQEHARPLGEHGAQRRQGRRARAAAAARADDGKPADGDAGHERRRPRRHDAAAPRARRHDPRAAGLARPHLQAGSGPAPARRRTRAARQAWAEGPARAARPTGPAAGGTPSATCGRASRRCATG